MLYIDLNFLGIREAIATAVIVSDDGVALVDPGPSSCLESLESGLRRQGVSLADISAILLTHVHLDHGGATGTLVRQYPRIRVFAHERGVRHLADPGKLIASAARFFGPDRMERYWAEVAPVPADRITVLQGGERVQFAGRPFAVLYTPGHASHHVTYLDESDGTAFVGDTAGMRIDAGYVLPPTPPPDIDVDAWLGSLDRIAALRPRELFITHFGPIADVDAHLQQAASNLRVLADAVRTALHAKTPDDAASESFARIARAAIDRAKPGQSTAPYEPTAPIESCWYGLARYWRKIDEQRSLMRPSAG